MLQQPEPKREMPNILYALFALSFAFSLVVAVLDWRRFIPLWLSISIYGGGIIACLWYWRRNRRAS